MKQAETLPEFYKRKFNWLPDNLRSSLGHFNVFRHEPVPTGGVASIPYTRRDFYKVMLVTGNSQVHYADQVVEVRKQALTFSNPLIPYKWERLDRIEDGVYCIFDKQFFHQFGNLGQYGVFQPGGHHVFELEDDEVETVNAVFQRMFAEISSDYEHKYDVLRNLVFELIHFALKKEPAKRLEQGLQHAAQRIATLFQELLERQFPIDDNHRQIGLKTPAGFAAQLNVHVNHLNRSVRVITQKTTSAIIAERILQEAKILLRHSHWNVSEIAYALGFREAPHFSSFFRKHAGMTPLQFRGKA